MKFKLDRNPQYKEISNNTTNDVKKTKPISQEHIPTFLELKKKIEQQSLPKEAIKCNIGKQVHRHSTIHILSESNVSNSSHSTSDDYSKKSQSYLQAEENQKYKRLKKKRKKFQTVICKDNSSDSDSSHVQSRQKYYARSIPRESTKNNNYEEARAAVLATSSGDDYHVDKETTNLESSCERILENALYTSNDANLQKCTENREYMYATIPDSHSYQIDLAKDEKLIKRAYVKVSRLSEKVTDPYQISQTDVRVSKQQLSFQHSDTKLHEKTHNSVNDGVIDHLCDLQSLDKIKPTDEKVKAAQRCRISKASNFRNKNKENTDTEDNKISDMSSEDSDANIPTSAVSDDKLKNISCSYKNGLDPTNGAIEHARGAVLETSSSGK